MDEYLERRAEFLKAIGQPTRLKVLDLLRRGERSVCDIFPAIGGQQSNISRHLQIMRRAGVLASRKQGLHVLYRIKDAKIRKLLQDVDGVFKRTRARRRVRQLG